jgi:hypothetical protein
MAVKNVKTEVHHYCGICGECYGEDFDGAWECCGEADK